MKTLYYVPIIHSAADLASLRATLEGIAATELGSALWLWREEIVRGFWDSVTRFFDSLDVCNFKIYQDALIAESEAGIKIVNEGVKEGSLNYALVSRLLERGAKLVKTEELYQVKKEYTLIAAIAHAQSPREKEVAAVRYNLAQHTLLSERDGYIAGRISETLAEGDKGVLFLGASHNILPKIPSDIRVLPVKDVIRIREFDRALLNIKDREYLNKLAKYVVSPVNIGQVLEGDF